MADEPALTPNMRVKFQLPHSPEINSSERRAEQSR
jgi:hypothetical protein